MIVPPALRLVPMAKRLFKSIITRSPFLLLASAAKLVLFRQQLLELPVPLHLQHRKLLYTFQQCHALDLVVPSQPPLQVLNHLLIICILFWNRFAFFTGNLARPPNGNRTVIFIQKQTNPGQDMFIRGGIDHTVRPGCVEDASTSPCAIPIQVKL